MKAWFKRYARVLWITTGIVAVIGSIAAYRTWDYIQHDPNFCTSCHLMDDPFDRWASSAHGQINCHDCHPGSLAGNLHQLWVQFTQNPTEVKKHAVVPAKICAACHLADDARWRQVGDTAGHKLHYGELGIECVKCHAPAIHEFLPTSAMCMKCHPAETVQLTAMQQLHCGTCHQFLAEPGQPLREGDTRCTECHAADSDVAPRAPVWHSQLRCIDCHPVHDGVMAAVAADPVAGPQRVDRVVPCSECHANEAALPMPEAHTCTNCHEPHSEAAGEGTCRDCHQAAAEALPPRDHHACADCHAPHAPEVPPEDQCADCHADRSTLSRGTPIEAHRACDACHTKHEVAAPDGPVCSKCHADTAAVVARGPAGHQKCAGCHAIHAPEAVRDCASCHRSEQAATRGSPRKHQRCEGCHQAHDARAEKATDCAKCHRAETAAARKQPAEHRDCSKCHATHGPKIPAKGGCTDCHQPVVAALAGEPTKHQDCASCHGIHTGSLKSGGAPCAKCHADQRPPPGAKHRQCATCHQPHRARVAKTCVQCHTKQSVASAPPAHRDCAKCHGEPHRVVAPKATCDSCHAQIAKVGLHRTPGHNDCKDCHRPHEADNPTAGQCARCHAPEQIRNHPAAAQGVKVCFGCHAFGR